MSRIHLERRARKVLARGKEMNWQDSRRGLGELGEGCERASARARTTRAPQCTFGQPSLSRPKLASRGLRASWLLLYFALVVVAAAATGFDSAPRYNMFALGQEQRRPHH